MSFVKWSSRTELERLRTDLDRLFGEFFEPAKRGTLSHRHPESDVIIPKVDIYNKNGSVVIKAELPGIEKDSINLAITKDALTIQGQVRKDEEVKEDDYYSIERNYGTFTRTIPLSDDIDRDKAKAQYKNGVLEIILPKKAEAKPKEIKININ